MSSNRVVVVGHGMSGVRFLEEMLRMSDQVDLSVIGDESGSAYNRILLSPVLAKELDMQQTYLHPQNWYEQNNIQLISGTQVVRVDRKNKSLHTKDGIEYNYDILVLALGSEPVRIPIPGSKLPGLLLFRTYEDVELINKYAKKGGPAVVIGGGLLGLEAANALRAQGLEVTVVHLSRYLMERQLDEKAAILLENQLKERGINVITQGRTKQILGQDDVEGIELEDGRKIPASLVVMTVGVRPRTILAQNAGLATERGIVVNQYMQTSDSSIYAVGECAQYNGICYGLVDPLWPMAEVAARHISGDGSQTYTPPPISAKLKVTGIHVFSSGRFQERLGDEVITYFDSEEEVYKKLVIHDGKLVGTLLYGDIGDAPWYADIMSSGESIGDIRDFMVFGQAYMPKKEVAKS